MKREEVYRLFSAVTLVVDALELFTDDQKLLTVQPSGQCRAGQPELSMLTPLILIRRSDDALHPKLAVSYYKLQNCVCYL